MPFGLVRLSGVSRLIFALISILFLALSTLYYLRPAHLSFRSSPNISRAHNETLGFGAIYVLTDDDTSWRVLGLRQAADFAGLRLTIPVQLHPSDQDVDTYLDGAKLTTIPKDIRAAINYASLLDIFLSSDYETALFFEDDVDFDVGIKSQMEIISDTLLSHISKDLRPDHEDGLLKETHTVVTPYPYGKDGWDVFWIGHYGVEFTKESQMIPYTDPHALPWDHLTSKYNNYYELLRAEYAVQPKKQAQQLMLSTAPIGTYAFALTRATAQGLVPKLRDMRVQQFDLALHDTCKDLDLRCIAPVPALMHHHRVTGNSEGKSNLSWWRERHKYTYNVQWSARCNAARVGEKLGERWQCLPGRYDYDE